ncbi:hypothetical protein TPHA_0D02060 [Tetrapisispora phaffii CBS 4417]|uniref:Uncharacterized protein n=1 Tax=Tetrapisispora phaffii (strain ATCC 24235 / CBS 4417 / NBRC 1672 / NRRL Y-8282 / UCD 70-5) TaxID=1071381 RepID=G8BSM3_TETPH|nr:hypothetical protein TPHA_0D02060 [Tetrapisispora phaffii CBS 4417]CCE62844.1 hypothetical protein TPHA_0D02060 [Tetrapisispora phaffii CBS 4417]
MTGDQSNIEIIKHTEEIINPDVPIESSIDRFSDNILVVGSTGLIGRNVLKSFFDTDLYIKHSQELKRLIASSEYDSTTRIKEVTIKKTAYSLTRKRQSVELFKNKTIVGQKLKEVELDGKTFYLQFDLLKQINDSGEPKESFLKSLTTKKMLEALTHGKGVKVTSNSKENQGISVRNEESSILKKDKSLLFSVINYNESEGNVILQPQEYSNVECYFNLQQYDSSLIFASSSGDILKINFDLKLYHLSAVDSTIWPSLLPVLFDSNTKLVPNKGLIENIDLTNEKLPLLSEVKVMLNSLGSRSHSPKNETFKNIDYKLNLSLINSFNNTSDKKVIIITSVNKKIYTFFSRYLNYKMVLEEDLKTNLDNKINELVILRPGPLVGTPMTTKLIPGLTAHLKRNDSSLKQLINYKRFAFDYKVALLRRIKYTGFEPTCTNILAKTFYRRPGTSLLGYTIPASKVAEVMVFKGLCVGLENVHKDTKVEILESKTIDLLLE